ncbi:unnamed protein product [Lactuca virosa]|uniref:Uncharacterized protein n=1 Tax=Lactuca virosa TaxID=75947 RepID=A0AAU9MDM7_9ASTR|nr:unnamed protein product [Lactuca virosa]
MITVDKNPVRGDFTTIQQAIDSLTFLNLIRVVIKVHVRVYKHLNLQFAQEDGWLSSFYSCLIKKYDKASIKCFELTSVLLENDPFHLKSTMVHIASAMELGHSNELYLMACKAISWFAVGCCSYCINKYDQSRRYFSKATSLGRNFCPWLDRI